MNTDVTYRPKGNLVWGGVAILLDGLFLAQALFYPAKGENLLSDLAIAVVVAVAAVLIWLRPKLVLQAEHIIVTNPVTSRKIAYSSITDIETKWTLLIHHSGERTRVWVAPANGKSRWMAESNARLFFTKIPRTEGKVVEITSMSQSHNSDSGVAARLILDRIEGRH
jgi:hypothetical protein